MSVSERVAPHLPYLRRFARAVTGSQSSGDAYVVSTLEALLADPSVYADTLAPRVALYRAFLKILNSVEVNNHSIPDQGHPGVDAVKRNLESLPARARQAFLLVAVEEFTPQQAAQILDVQEQDVQAYIDEAGREIARQMATDVRISLAPKRTFRSAGTAAQAMPPITPSTNMTSITSGDCQAGKNTGIMPASKAPRMNWPSAPMFQTLAV